MKTPIRTFLFTILLVLTTNIITAQNEFEVNVKGSGQPVLLFPGFTSTAEVWEGMEKQLSENFEVHSFTFAGFGGVKPIDFPWLPQIKTAISNYVKEKNLKDPIIIGHSLGGTLGLWLAADSPKVYSRIIVVDALPAMGALMMPDYNSEKITYDAPYNKQLMEMNDEDFQKMATQMAASMSLNKEKHELLKNWIIRADRGTYVYGYTDLLKLDLRKDLSKISTPVTILAATHPFGRETAEKTYRDQYKHLNSYTLNFAENSGHFIMFDQPDWFLNALKTELKF